VWCAVDEVNRELIIFADEARPFVYISKGGLNRWRVLEIYQRDIDEAYARLGVGRAVNEVVNGIPK